MRAYLPERRLPREELGFSRFSRQKTENRPSLSGRFSCPVWAAPAGRRARLFSHAEAFVAGLIADAVAAVLHYLTTALSAFYIWVRRLLPELGSFLSGSRPGLEGAGFAQAPKALGADHQMIKDFHPE